MTDGQSFMLVMLGLYALECFALVRPGERVLVRGWGKFYREREPFLDLEGARKRVVFLTFLPLPGRSHVILPAVGEGIGLYGRAGLRRLGLLNEQADGMRWRGVLIFVVFFLLVPAVYRFSEVVNLRLIGLVVFAYGLGIWQTCAYRAKHRRFFPKADEERLKQVLSMPLLPWVAMKGGDKLALRPDVRNHPLVVCRELMDKADFEKLAGRTWREVVVRGEDELEKNALSDYLRELGYDLEKLMEVPTELIGASRYCPLCLTGYEESGSECSDCDGVKTKMI